MPPHGVSCALSEDESSHSLMVDSSAENGDDSSILSNLNSQTSPEQDICHTLSNSGGSVCEADKLQPSPNSSSKGAHTKTALCQLKKDMSSPVKQVLVNPYKNPCLSHASVHLIESSNEKTSITKDVSQQATDNAKKMYTLNNKSRNESSALLSEPSTKAETSKDNSCVGSKVVVQAMPLIDFGNISALQQCISDSSISRKSDLKSNFKDSDSRKRLFESEKLITTSKSKVSHMSLSGMNETQDSGDDFISSDYSAKRIRRNHTFNFHIRPGRGEKLLSIEYISSALSEVSSNTLRLVHYVMFGTYGVVRSDSAIEQTKTNILHFSGFPFNEFSEEYKKKFKSLMRLPFPILLDIYILLVRQESVERATMVRQLLQFCLKPARRKVSSFRSFLVAHNDRVLKQLKNRILKEPPPIVMLERLSDQFIQRMINKSLPENGIGISGTTTQDHKRYTRPSYIENGPGHKLKSFPKVIDGVCQARRRIINLLHMFLYGRPGSDEVNRVNILEFSGFLQNDKFFVQRKIAILNRYRKEEFQQICDIFSFYVKGSSKVKKMKKLLFFLQAPSLVVNGRDTGLPVQAESESTQKLKKPANELLIQSEPQVTKLRDFEQICLNIECAPPGDLAELNDILFIKPCDVSEIHEKILNFTSFTFDENSLEFHYRKTLMHYMGIEIIKKVARILNIPFEEHVCQQELAMTSLKFLMNMKQPVKTRKRVKYVPQQTKRRMRSAQNQKCRPLILKIQSEQDANSEAHKTQEYLKSSSSGKMDSMPSLDGFHESGDTEDGSNSTVVIQRISESSYSWTDLKNNGPITISNLNSDESLSLHEFAHHPTENQLELTVKEVICSNSWSITIGDLLNKVLHNYPKHNLMYRCEFIKTKALEIIHEMQECLVDSTLDTT